MRTILKLAMLLMALALTTVVVAQENPQVGDVLTVLTTINVRTQPETTSNDVGDLFMGDVIVPLEVTPNGNWVYFSGIQRVGGNVNLTGWAMFRDELGSTMAISASVGVIPTAESGLPTPTGSVDFYEVPEQEAVGEQVVESVEGTGQGGGGFAAQSVEEFDPTSWGDCFADGFHWPQGQEYVARERNDSEFVVAEVANRLYDRNSDNIYELEPEADVWTTHALLFSQFMGENVQPCALTIPNEIRMEVVEVDNEAPDRVSFTVRRNQYSPTFDKDWEVLSGGTGYVLMQIGSVVGADVVVEVFGEKGGFHVEGQYCSLCLPGTGVNGDIAQFEYESKDYNFEESADMPTSDVLSLFMPNDFSAVTITLTNFGDAAADQPLAEIWWGSGTPTEVVG